MVEAIGGDLANLRKAMSHQKTFDYKTADSVADLAKLLIQKGVMEDLKNGEVMRIVSAVKNSFKSGEKNLEDNVQKIFDIMVNSQLRTQKNQFDKLLSIRASKVNDKGIEVQGELDVRGQQVMRSFKDALRLPLDRIEERLNEVADELNNPSSKLSAESASVEYDALSLAKHYYGTVDESSIQYEEMKKELQDAEKKYHDGQLPKDAYYELKENLMSEMRQNRIDRIMAYRKMVREMTGVLSGSVDAAKAFRDAEKARIDEIHHNANSDLEGVDAPSQHSTKLAEKIVNSNVVKVFTQTLPSFDAMLKLFAPKAADGKGYLYDRYMGGWVKASENERIGRNETFGILDKKAEEMFGKGMRWDKLAEKARSMKLKNGGTTMTVSYYDDGKKREAELSTGNLMYIYMVNKMADGEMKLRKMGITSADVEEIKEQLPDKLVQIADWLQDEFYVQTRDKYNEVHKRLFGASMAAVENYVPLKILDNAIGHKEDVGKGDYDDKRSAVTTGSIIKRVRNTKPIDLFRADAFNVTTDHVNTMEHWAAFSELSRDINTLLSYKKFANRVRNMNTIYGGGSQLFNSFRKVCTIATGNYKPDAGRFDKSAVNLAKFGTMAKVSFRGFTAIKQLSSMPAYLPDTNPLYFAKNLAMPRTAFKWALENLPLFEKRWVGRLAGEEKLIPTDMDVSFWRSKMVRAASKYGMMPNAFFDAVTVAVGAKAIYDTKLRKYLRQGFDEAKADELAKQDATILFNETQQSSESAFLSAMQCERSWLSVMLTAFRNSPISYERKVVEAMRGLKHKLRRGYRDESIAYMTKKYVRNGLTYEQAKKAATQDYNRSLGHDLVQVGTFGFLMQAAWNIIGHGAYLLLGSDDDEKKKTISDDMVHAVVGGWIEGLTGGDIISDGISALINDGELSSHSLGKEMPIVQDIENAVKEFGYDKVLALNDLICVLVESGVGVNPQTISDGVIGIMDICQQDEVTAKEVAIMCARILQVPQSQLDKVYFDELGCSGMEAKGLTPQQVAERYAAYKVKRATALTGWLYNKSEEAAAEKRFIKMAKDNLKKKVRDMGDADINEAYKMFVDKYSDISKQEDLIKQQNKFDEEGEEEATQQLAQNPDYQGYITFKSFETILTDLVNKWLKTNNYEDKHKIEKQMADTKRRMVEALSEISE
jgi:hypothetical protein